MPLQDSQEQYLRARLPAIAIYSLKELAGEDDVTICDGRPGLVMVSCRGRLYNWSDYSWRWLEQSRRYDHQPPPIVKPGKISDELLRKMIDPGAIFRVPVEVEPEGTVSANMTVFTPEEAKELKELLAILKEETHSRSVHARCIAMLGKIKVDDESP